MGFLDKAKGLADQAMAKADEAMNSATSASPKQADSYFRDLGVIAYLEATGRPLADADQQRERCTTSLQQLEQTMALNLTMSSVPPPAPGAAAGSPPPPPGAAATAPPPPPPGGAPSAPPPPTGGPATAPPPPPPGAVQPPPPPTGL